MNATTFATKNSRSPQTPLLFFGLSRSPPRRAVPHPVCITPRSLPRSRRANSRFRSKTKSRQRVLTMSPATHCTKVKRQKLQNNMLQPHAETHGPRCGGTVTVTTEQAKNTEKDPGGTVRTTRGGGCVFQGKETKRERERCFKEKKHSPGRRRRAANKRAAVHESPNPARMGATFGTSTRLAALFRVLGDRVDLGDRVTLVLRTWGI